MSVDATSARRDSAATKVATGEAGVPLVVEALATEHMSEQVKRWPRKLTEREVSVTVDWNEETAQLAPFYVLACMTSFAEYEAALKAYSIALNHLVGSGRVVSFFSEPSRCPIVMQPEGNTLRSLKANDGYALFAFVHMLPVAFLELRSKHPFLGTEGEPLKLWKAVR